MLYQNNTINSKVWFVSPEVSLEHHFFVSKRILVVHVYTKSKKKHGNKENDANNIHYYYYYFAFSAQLSWKVLLAIFAMQISNWKKHLQYHKTVYEMYKSHRRVLTRNCKKSLPTTNDISVITIEYRIFISIRLSRFIFAL